MTRTKRLSFAAVALALPVWALAQTASPTPTPTQTPTPGTSQQTLDPALKRADANGDNKLSKAEAARMPAIAAKFDELDKDKDGSLSPQELMAAPTK